MDVCQSCCCAHTRNGNRRLLSFPRIGGANNARKKFKNSLPADTKKRRFLREMLRGGFAVRYFFLKEQVRRRRRSGKSDQKKEEENAFSLLFLSAGRNLTF